VKRVENGKRTLLCKSADLDFVRQPVSRLGLKLRKNEANSNVGSNRFESRGKVLLKPVTLNDGATATNLLA